MKTRTYPIPGGEVRLMTVRETPITECTTPEHAATYWREHVETSPRFHPDKENLVVLHLNTRRRITGFDIASVGTLDSTLAAPREIFRAAVIANASGIICMHNHPSGDPLPSEADIRITRELITAGGILRIDLLDHVIIGTRDANSKGWASLRELGYFH